MKFEACHLESVLFEDGDFKIRTVHIINLIIAKKAAGRPKDLNDPEHLQ